MQRMVVVLKFDICHVIDWLVEYLRYLWNYLNVLVAVVNVTCDKCSVHVLQLFLQSMKLERFDAYM